MTTLPKAILLAAAIIPGVALAQDSPHSFTGKVALYSEYEYRGISQTSEKPAVQLTLDYAHASGFYVGTFVSNIKWLKDTGDVLGDPMSANIEWDIYGGYKWGFAPDWTLDLGTLYYYYPGDINPATAAVTVNALTGTPVGVPKADTWEVYAGLSWKWLSAKLSYSLDNKTFGVLDSSGTYYLDFTAAYPIPDTKFTLIGHYGLQKYNGTDPRNFVVGGVQLDNDNLFSYDDWKLGINYALPKDFTVGFFYTDTSSDNVLGYGSVNDVGAGGNRGPFPKRISKGTGTVFISKTF